MRGGKRRSKVALRDQPQNVLWPRDMDRFFERGFGSGPLASLGANPKVASSLDA